MYHLQSAAQHRWRDRATGALLRFTRVTRDADFADPGPGDLSKSLITILPRALPKVARARIIHSVWLSTQARVSASMRWPLRSVRGIGAIKMLPQALTSAHDRLNLLMSC